MGACQGKTAAPVSNGHTPQPQPTLLGTVGEVVESEAPTRSSVGHQSHRLKNSNHDSVANDDVIIQPKGKHTHTVILLHGLYGTGHDFTKDVPGLTGVPAAVRKVSDESSDGIKYIFPTAPKRTMHWPKSEGGDERNVHAWYTYFSDKGDTMHADDDKISTEEFDAATAQLIKLVEAEVAELGDSKRVIIGGNSQGGTVAINAAMAAWPNGVPAALLCLRTCPMRITTVNTCTENMQMKIFAFIDGLDDVYPVKLQKHNYNTFKEAGYALQDPVVPGVTHEQNSQKEETYAATWIVEAFSLATNGEDSIVLLEASPRQASASWWKCC